MQSRQPIRSWQAHSASVRSLQFHPRGHTLFSASVRGGEALAWQPAVGNEIERYPLNADWITGLALSGDGQTLAVFGGSFHHPGKIRVVDVADGRERFLFTVPSNTVSTAAFSADGRTLFAGTRPPLNPLVQPRDGQVYRWDLTTGQELPPLQERLGGKR
jgi:WD40 repeat protein